MTRLLAGLSAIALIACGGTPPQPRKPAVPKTAPSASTAPGDGFATWDERPTRAADEAPLMRPIERVSGAYELRAERDVCVRAVFAAAGPVRVFLLDDDNALRGDAGEGASGVVPPAGPACARKGERLRLVTTAQSETPFRILLLRSP